MHAPGLVTDQCAAILNPANRTVGADDAILGLQGRFRNSVRKKGRLDARPILRVNPLDPEVRVRIQFLAGVSPNLLEGRADIKDFGQVGIGQPEHLADVGGHLFKPFLAFPERPLRLLSRRDVARHVDAAQQLAGLIQQRCAGDQEISAEPDERRRPH